MIGYCVLVMLALTLLNIIMGNGFISTEISSNTNNVIINGSSTQVQDVSVGIAIDPVQGLIAFIIIIATVCIVAGIQILGSGLSETSLKWLTLAVGYGGLWVLLSSLAYPLIIQITYFGSLIYIVFTILFVYGVFQKGIGGSEEG